MGWILMRFSICVALVFCSACATTEGEIRQMGRLGDTSALISEWDAATSDSKRLVVFDALVANAETKAARRIILSEAPKSRSAAVRRAAVKAATGLDGDDARDVLIAALADPLPDLREIAKAGLQSKGAAVRGPLLATLAGGAAPYARAASAKLLGGMKPDEATVSALLNKARRDDAPVVREAAVVALGRLGIGRTRGVLQQARQQDDDAAVRIAAERALAKLGDAGVDRIVVAVWPIRNATGLRDVSIERALRDLRSQLAARIGASKVAEVVEEDQLKTLEQHWLKLGDNMYDGDAPNLVGPGFAKIATQFIYGALSRSGNELTLVLNRLDAATGTQVPGASLGMRGAAVDLPRLMVDAGDRVIARFR